MKQILVCVTKMLSTYVIATLTGVFSAPPHMKVLVPTIYLPQNIIVTIIIIS